MNDLAKLQEREIGTTPSGGAITLENEPHNGNGQKPLRWQKMTAYLVAVALLAAVAVFALIKAPDSAALVYGTFAGALVSALLSYTAGNVAEHRVLAGLSGLFGAKK
jgi:DeoR/GlpR family transcriptional regulator of sugar metabolism